MLDVTKAEAAALRAKPFPIQGHDPITWEAAEVAYRTYVKHGGSGQSLEMLARRGGFGLCEFACFHQGHLPGNRWDFGERDPHLACIRRAFQGAEPGKAGQS